MVERIIDHNLRVFSREMKRLKMESITPLERISAVQNHLRNFRSLRELPQAERKEKLKQLLERARKDPALDEELKGQLIDVYA